MRRKGQLHDIPIFHSHTIHRPIHLVDGFLSSGSAFWHVWFIGLCIYWLCCWFALLGGVVMGAIIVGLLTVAIKVIAGGCMFYRGYTMLRGGEAMLAGFWFAGMIAVTSS